MRGVSFARYLLEVGLRRWGLCGRCFHWRPEIQVRASRSIRLTPSGNLLDRKDSPRSTDFMPTSLCPVQSQALTVREQRVERFAHALGLKFQRFGAREPGFVVVSGSRGFTSTAYGSVQEFWSEWSRLAHQALADAAWVDQVLATFPSAEASERDRFFQWWRGKGAPYAPFMASADEQNRATFRLPRNWRAQYVALSRSLESLASTTFRFELMDQGMARRGYADYDQPVKSMDGDRASWGTKRASASRVTRRSRQS